MSQSCTWESITGWHVLELGGMRGLENSRYLMFSSNMKKFETLLTQHIPICGLLVRWVKAKWMVTISKRGPPHNGEGSAWRLHHETLEPSLSYQVGQPADNDLPFHVIEFRGGQVNGRTAYSAKVLHGSCHYCGPGVDLDEVKVKGKGPFR